MADLIVKIEGAEPYSFTDEKTGRKVEGVNCFHLIETDRGVGKVPAKITLPYETWNAISAFPFPCDCKLITKEEFTRKGIMRKVIGLNMVK